METLPNSKAHLQYAEQLLAQNKPDALMPNETDLSPISAYRYLYLLMLMIFELTIHRYHSFMSHGGDDDMFSSDLTDEELNEVFKHIKVNSSLFAGFWWRVFGFFFFTVGRIFGPNIVKFWLWQIPVLLCSSMRDEYVPNHVDLHALTSRLVSVISRFSKCFSLKLEARKHFNTR